MRCARDGCVWNGASHEIPNIRRTTYNYLLSCRHRRQGNGANYLA